MPPGRIPPLNFATRVSANTAKQDKIGITVHHGFINDTAEDVALFLHFLGTPPRDQRGIDPSPFGQIFNRPRREEPPFATQIIRGTPRIGEHPIPLFAGHLKVKSPRENNPYWQLETLLSLNPTRFVRYQEFSGRQVILENISSFAYRLTRADSSPPELFPNFESEFAYLESDNWIPDNRFWATFTSPRHWRQHLEWYLRTTVSAVNADLHRAAEHQTIEIRPPLRNPCNLSSVETYWEFYAEEPLRMVRELQPMLELFASSTVQTREYPIEYSATREQNSLRLNLQTHNGETVKIYAKTSRRIRIEITHQLNGNRPFILPVGGHTFPAVGHIPPILSQLATVAAERVNELLEFFRNRSSVPQNQHTVLKFISEIQAACGNTQLAYELLSLLVNNSSVVVGPGIPIREIYGDALRCLVRRGVLQTSHRRYSVMPAYTRALNAMQDTGVGPMLGPRIRVRNRNGST